MDDHRRERHAHSLLIGKENVLGHSLFLCMIMVKFNKLNIFPEGKSLTAEACKKCGNHEFYELKGGENEMKALQDYSAAFMGLY